MAKICHGRGGDPLPLCFDPGLPQNGLLSEFVGDVAIHARECTGNTAPAWTRV
jgi:hypothetical protein